MTTFGLDGVRFGGDGLVPVIAQEETTGEVLMLAWANREALQRTLQDGWMTYWSRSRRELWQKGSTSGNRQRLVRLSIDCDGDAVHALVRMEGPACHTGAQTCFGRPGEPVPLPVLADLDATIQSRKVAPPPGSYTAQLLGDPKRAAKKIGEESAELVHALAGETGERVAEEAADVIYHALVASAARGVDLRQILDTLGRRRT